MNAILIYFRLFFSVFVILAFTSHGYSYSYEHEASNARDTNPETWHFIPDATPTALTRSDRITQLDNALTSSLLGQSEGFDILIDGQSVSSYNWQIFADPGGIDDNEFASSSYPANGNVVVDTYNGRLKFSNSPSFKYAAGSGYTLPDYSASSEKPVLVASARYKNASLETMVTLAAFYDGSKYRYAVFELAYDGTIQRENIASFDDSDGYKVTVADLPSGSPDSCTEIYSDDDPASTASFASFALYCKTGSSGILYGFQYNGSMSAETVASSLPQDTDHSRMADVAVDANNATYIIFTATDSGISGTRIQQKTFGAATEDINFAANSAAGSRCSNIFSDSPVGDGVDAHFDSAADPAIDCAAGSCFIAYRQYIRKIASPGTCTNSETASAYLIAFKKSEMTSTVTDPHNNVVPVHNQPDDILYEPYVQAINANEAMVVYRFAPGISNIPRLNAAVLAYHKNSSGYVWPRSAGFTSGKTGYDIATVSRINEDVPVYQVALSIDKGKNVHIAYSQGSSSGYSSTDITGKKNEPPENIHKVTWRYNNLNSISNQILFDEEFVYTTASRVSGLNLALADNGSGFIGYLNDEGMSFAGFTLTGKTTLHSSIEQNPVTALHRNTGLNQNAFATVYTTQPSVSGGRMVLIWAENDKIYSRSYYPSVKVEVKYHSKTYGTLLDRDGALPPTVRNNYIKPGDLSSAVEVYVNSMQSNDVVTVEIYTATGELVYRLCDNCRYNSFNQPLLWHQNNGSGAKVASGVYHVVIKKENKIVDRHAVVIVR